MSSNTAPKPFLNKLFKMVDEAETDAIVSWTPAGDALVVHDDEAFAQQLPPLYFKHNNFSSFVRQLNTYASPLRTARFVHAAAGATSGGGLVRAG